MASEESRKSFLLRTDPKVLAALKKWAADEMRSVNGQLEYLLRQALIDAGRLKSEQDDSADDDSK
ncbi:MAG: hypothetical protein ACFCD0_25360 [Gemmataceae bacterium]